MASAHHSPPSSLSDAPSEPTIDLSSWSPRSYRILHAGKYKWKQKQPLPAELVAEEKLQSHNTPSPQMEDLTPLFSGNASPIERISQLSQIHFTSGHTSATKNQSPTFQIEQTFSLMHASLLSVPSHIAINSLPFLRTTMVDSYILRAIQENPQANFVDWGYYAVSEQNLQSNGDEDISIVLNKRGQ